MTETVDGYIEKFPDETRIIMENIRAIVRETIPDVVEGISYGMPSYKVCGKPLVYFAGFKNHVGFYATPAGHEAFADELSHYKQGKGSVQFLLNKPVPYDLIKRMVKYKADATRKNTGK
ncbi:MAG: DUF1801 domain-containing protein, partial [Cytophagaceae bacterium]|nr:DUF1801 domain-containing protein [Cytophagaceae bacterium]